MNLFCCTNFSFVDEENEIDLSRFSYVDTMVTVVDAFNFFKDFGSPETLWTGAYRYRK